MRQMINELKKEVDGWVHARGLDSSYEKSTHSLGYIAIIVSNVLMFMLGKKKCSFFYFHFYEMRYTRRIV